MRDKTLIILALLFLTVTVGAGVNKSLEACNRVLGKPMASGIGETYHRQWPRALSLIKDTADYGKRMGITIFNQKYRIVGRQIEQVKSKIDAEVRSRILPWREKVYRLAATAKEKLGGKKRPAD